MTNTSFDELAVLSKAAMQGTISVNQTETAFVVTDDNGNQRVESGLPADGYFYAALANAYRAGELVPFAQRDAYKGRAEAAEAREKALQKALNDVIREYDPSEDGTNACTMYNIAIRASNVQ